MTSKVDQEEMPAEVLRGRRPESSAIPDQWTWGRRPVLDGLRALAVYMVVLFHADVGLFSSGFIGVDLFFVLSGYLILNVVRRDLDRPTPNGVPRLAVTEFYARRVRRLLPAASVAVLGTAALWSLTTTPFERLQELGAARSAIGYYANWFFLGQQTDYFSQEMDPSPFLHFWSLAIEGQFYLVVPLLGAVILLAGRRVIPKQTVPLVVGLLLVGSATWQWVLSKDSAATAYLSTFSRSYQILAGVLLALAIPPIVNRSRTRIRAAREAGGRSLLEHSLRFGLPIAVLAFVLWGTRVISVDNSTRGFGASILAVLIILFVELDRSSAASAALASKPVVYLGWISYGTYLWHWPVLVLAGRFVEMTPSAAVILSAGVGTALAALSFQLVERPFQDSQRLRRSALPTLIVALAWTALVWFVLLPWLLDNDAPRRVVSLESESVSQPAVLESKTPIPPYVPTDPALKEIGFDQDCFGEPFESCVIVPGDGLRIHVMGDSHARAIIPAFAEVAESNGYRLSVSVAASCTWQRNYYYTDTDEQRPECDLERPDWYERVLPELDPDLIVMVNRPFDDPQNPWVMESDSPELAGLGQQELHEAVTRRSLDALSELDARLVVVEQTPIARSSGFPCLSEATWVEECAFDATPGPSPTEQQLRRFASNSDQLWTIDMDSVACPRLPACDPFVGENLVRYDAQHLSVPFARAAGSQVWKLVDEAGVLDGIEAEH